MEEDKDRKGLTAKIDKIFDEGDRMRQEKGSKTPAQQLKEAAVIGGIALAGVGGTGVIIVVDNYAHPKATLNPDKSIETVLPANPEHMKPTQQIIENFKNKNDGGFADKVEAGKQDPNNSMTRK